MITSKEQKSKKKYPTLLGLAYRYQREDDSWAFGLNYARVIFLLIVLVLLMWSIVSIFLFYKKKYRDGFEDMSLKDAYVMPFDKGDIDKRHGDLIIERAKVKMEEGDYQSALVLLEVGTSMSIANLDGRLLLAKLEVDGKRRPDFALKTLKLGVPYALNNIEYMRAYLHLLLREGEDTKIIALGDKLLAMSDEEVSMEVKVYTAMTMSTVYAMHGNYEKSSELIDRYNVANSIAGILRVSKNLWEMGNRQAAIDVAGRASYLKGVDIVPVQTLLMNYYIEMEDYDMARTYVALRRLARPFDISIHIDYISILEKQNNPILVKNEINFVFNLAKEDSNKLLDLARYAANNKDLDLMERIYTVAIERGYSMAMFSLLRIETLLMEEMYLEAQVALDKMYEEKQPWFKPYRGYFDCLYCAAYAGTANNSMASVKLNEIIAANAVPEKILLATSRRLNKIGNTDLAYKLLLHLVEKNPLSQLGLSRLMEMEMDMGNPTNLDNYMTRLMNMRRAPLGILKELRVKLDSDTFIFTPNRESIIAKMDALLYSEDNRLSSEDNSLHIEYDDRIIE